MLNYIFTADKFFKAFKTDKESERQLNPNVMVTYKRLQTLATLLTNYKILLIYVLRIVNVEKGV